jgi:acyl phosphate:glycerol-3-phosphate acyltransferase
LWVRVPLPAPGRGQMTWFIIALGYVLGSIPTAYIAGRLKRGKDIRESGDGNMGAQNAFRQLGPGIGILIGLIDTGKGALAIIIAQSAGLSQWAIFLTGGVTVIGHNWPFVLGFRGGRGEATTIGILYILITVPALIVTFPALLTLFITRNVTLSSAVAFVPLPFVCWWLHVPGVVITYSIGLLLLVAFTHLLRTRQTAIRRA